LAAVALSSEVSLLLLTKEELQEDYAFVLEQGRGGHWLPLFDKQLRDEWSDSNVKSVGGCTPLHFYGFKGGQARSTVLCMLARSLADSGYNVLLVDADIEAPSLHLMFGIAPTTLGSSFLGVCTRDGDVEPASAETTFAGGSIDLIVTSPAIDDFEMDFASFVIRATMDSSVIERGVSRIAQYAGVGADAGDAKYDYIIFDHRTGLSSSVLPIVSACPGSVVINVRPDGLSDGQGSIVDALLSANFTAPGAFVCFSLDPEKRKDAVSEAEERIREKLLYKMADAISRGAENASPDELDGFLDDYFVPWFHDRAFLGGSVVKLNDISKDNIDSILQLRRVLGVPNQSPIRDVEDFNEAADAVSVTSPSGALDTGWFVETPDVTRLLQPSLPSFYIYGRKGTGKTRLFKELVSRGLGRPLHSAADFNIGGLQAQSASEIELLDAISGDYQLFWWALLAADLSAILNDTNIQVELNGMLLNGVDGLKKSASLSSVSRLAKQLTSKYTFLIDGVETAVDASKTVSFVEALFRFLSTMQNDITFVENIKFKVFIRSDLPVGVQNVEQQVHGRKVDLRWDESSIFHYVLAEVVRTQWFESNFSDVCRVIDENRRLVRTGGLEREVYEELLLRIFPQKLRRNNLSTMTFLRTYFSDAAGEGDSRSSFYPRVFGSFLSKVAEIGRARGASALDVDQRVSHDVVLEAFEHAARDFINEVKQELNFALNIGVTAAENRQHVSDLLESFGGLPTPFELDKCVEVLASKLPSPFNPKVVRDCLRRMKDMGIFEDHPADPRKWRAGRLFKEGLRMKYVRK
jgi:MinD-like ATPase involved in chromosome partitioning or flagellar assembly